MGGRWHAKLKIQKREEYLGRLGLKYRVRTNGLVLIGRQDKKDWWKLWKECGYDSKILREFPYDDRLSLWLSW